MAGDVAHRLQSSPIEGGLLHRRPRTNVSNTKTADNIASPDFMKRQEMHIKKQQKLLEKSWQLHHRSDLVKFNVGTTAQYNNDKVTDGENVKDKHAWGSPSASPDLVEKCANDETKLDHSTGYKQPAYRSKLTLVRGTHAKSRDIGPVLSISLEPGSMSGQATHALSNLAATEGEMNKRPRKLANISINLERLQLAKETADQAIRTKRIFSIAGPYPFVRESLRRRGWIEKFYKLEEGVNIVGESSASKTSPRAKKKKNHGGGVTDDDDDDDDLDDDGDDDAHEDENAVKPWEEENGIYGIMSRMARNNTPTFIWSMRRDSIDFRFLKKEQMVNHYSKNGAFTTKVGLCTNLRSARWFQDVDHDTFYPRCYRLSQEEEKGAFIDDFYLTASMSVIRWVIARHRDGLNREVSSDGENGKEEEAQTDGGAKQRKTPAGELHLPVSLLDQALRQCKHWIAFKENEDLEDLNSAEMIDMNWEEFLRQYYDLCHNGWIMPKTRPRLGECEMLATKLREYWPQFDLDGMRNVWIVKPGAKSRGRGIVCYDKLQDMLKLVDSVVRKDSKYVVQKYMERPLLIHHTKFDIRQWFLVTDWNPLTVWWYKDCYLRFCKLQFSLADFNEAIHLSNNSIQKHYDVDPDRSKEIPEDSMWSSEKFEDYLRSHGFGEIFADMCQPKMKESVICALLTTQDIVEFRKSSFELYGADFMLTDDLKPWLIEINSSPSMATSTRVTADLVPRVLDDMMKVLLDRKLDKGCDVGGFELIYKPTAVVTPQYLGISLAVDGVALKGISSGGSDGVHKSKKAAAAEGTYHISTNNHEGSDEGIGSGKWDEVPTLEVKGKKKVPSKSKDEFVAGLYDSGGDSKAEPMLARRKAKHSSQIASASPARERGGPSGSVVTYARDSLSDTRLGLPSVFEDMSLVRHKKPKKKKKKPAAPFGALDKLHHQWSLNAAPSNRRQAVP